MTAYSRGNYHEKRVADQLRDDGYQVWQTRGSKSPADLLAVKPGQVLLVQVKAATSKMHHSSWNQLYDLAALAGAVPVVASRPLRGLIRWQRIVGEHRDRSKAWPSVPFATDEVLS